MELFARHNIPVSNSVDEPPPLRPMRRNAVLLLYDAPFYRDWAFWLTAFWAVLTGWVIGTSPPTPGVPRWLDTILAVLVFSTVGGVIPAIIRLQVRKWRWRRGQGHTGARSTEPPGGYHAKHGPSPVAASSPARTDRRNVGATAPSQEEPFPRPVLRPSSSTRPEEEQARQARREAEQQVRLQAAEQARREAEDAEFGAGGDTAGSRPVAPGRIFISYRRAESGYSTGWLYERLANHFGRENIVRDIDSIEPGDNFAEVIGHAVASCDVMLVVIGTRWISIAKDDGHRRLDDPDDFVRREIEAALQREIRVIPILVDGATMPPTEQLPPSLATLRHRQALDLSPQRFQYDVDRLLRVLDKTVSEQKK